jgi:hypothetical protein
MAKLKFSANTASVSVMGLQFQTDDEGVIDTGNAPDTVVMHLISTTGCTVVETTEEEDRQNVKDKLIEALAVFGLKADRRKSVESLQAMLDAHKAAQPEA